MDLNLCGRLSQFFTTLQRELLPMVEADIGETLTAPFAIWHATATLD
jgi:hypothetical protein